MSKLKNVSFCYIIALFVAGLSAADLKSDNDNIKMSVKGNGAFKFGQVVRGLGIGEKPEPVWNLWVESANTGFSIEAVIDERLKLVSGINAEMKFSWPLQAQRSQSKTAQPHVSMSESYGLYTVKGNRCAFDMCVGYFGYKYNPDVRNLGEYLFRSATYPAYIITDFDSPQATLLGLRLGLKTLNNSFSHDLILSSETVFYPAMDWSLSYLFKYDILNNGFLNIGAGINIAHLFSVYPENVAGGSNTSPTSPVTQYKTDDGDTANYTFKGSKLMARLSIDPKVLISGANDFFGKSDLKIYGELLVIGTKSYPDTTLQNKATLSYSNWKEKAPITFGFNLPTFALLDVLSLEFEYWGSKYYNDYRAIYVNAGYPVAQAPLAGVDESKWKWSLYFKKSFLNDHCALTTQFARDHMRLFSTIYDEANHREMLVESGNWWWVTKLSYSF